MEMSQDFPPGVKQLLAAMRSASITQLADQTKSRGLIYDRLAKLEDELEAAKREAKEATRTPAEESTRERLENVRQQLRSTTEEEKAAEEAVFTTMAFKSQVKKLYEEHNLSVRDIVAHQSALLSELKVDLSCCPEAQELTTELMRPVVSSPGAADAVLLDRAEYVPALRGTFSLGIKAVVRVHRKDTPVLLAYSGVITYKSRVEV